MTLKKVLPMFILMTPLFILKSGAQTMQPQADIFQPEIVSSGLHEHSGFIMSPNGQRAMWVISLNGHKIILESERKEEAWMTAKIASFSGQYRDEYPFFAPDGQTLFFMSWRPLAFEEGQRNAFAHWRVDWKQNEWGRPQINTQWSEKVWVYSMNTQRDVFGWTRTRQSPDRNDADIVQQVYRDGIYEPPADLGPAINSTATEYAPFIDPNGEYLIFCRMGTDSQDGIYISFFQKGKWSPAQRLPKSINFGQSERFPWVSPDGKTLFFNRQIFRPSLSSPSRYESLRDIHEHALKTPSNGVICAIDMKYFLQLNMSHSGDG